MSIFVLILSERSQYSKTSTIRRASHPPLLPSPPQLHSHKPKGENQKAKTGMVQNRGMVRKKFYMSIRKTHTKPFGIRDSEFGVRDSGFGIRDSGFGFGVRGSGFGVRGTLNYRPLIFHALIREK